MPLCLFDIHVPAAGRRPWQAGTVPAPVPEMPPPTPDVVPPPPMPRPPDQPPEIIEPPQPGEHVPVRDPYPAGPPSAIVVIAPRPHGPM